MKKYLDPNGNLWEGGCIIVDGKTIINPTEDVLAANGYIKIEKNAADILEESKKAKIAEIDAYDISENVNVFYVGNMPMWLDFEERSRILASINAYRKLGMNEMTKIYEGMEFTWPLAVWEDMLAAVEVYASECKNVTERHKKDVLDALNTEDVEAVDITGSYPDKLNFDSLENDLDQEEEG